VGQLKATDSCILNYPADYVYRVVADIAAYHKWWPREISFELLYLDPAIIGTVVDVHNGMFVSWKAMVSGFRTNKLLAIDYTEGDWIGSTEWRFEESRGTTKLTLEIDLEINRSWLKAVSLFMNFSKFHSKQIRRVFANLEKYLAENESTYLSGIRISEIDHIVLTVKDIERTCEFYRRVMGMEVITFGENRKALKFGGRKINLHVAGNSYSPMAENPLPGSADMCFIVHLTPEEVIKELKSKGVAAELGPVERAGAEGRISSVYFRDPDGNLIELASYSLLPDSK
jgi:catechol 2,3-dioxygenase-like lactoylglutathione lyase family enzyme/ribosome-associated toxin RatA of RatAB toxin-antitoxin module